MSFRLTKDVVEALVNGDHQMFERVFLAYFKNVKLFVQSLIKSEHESEEIAQELFVKLWTNRDSLGSVKFLSSYIFLSAKNAALDYLKWKYVRDSFYNDQIQGEEETVNTEDDYYAKETKSLIELAVSKMPEQRQKVYTLSRNDGKSNDEIAKMLNITKKTVENHMNLALKEVRSVLNSANIFLL